MTPKLRKITGIKFFIPFISFFYFIGLSYFNIYKTLQYIPNKLNNTQAIIAISHLSHFRRYESHTQTVQTMYKKLNLFFFNLFTDEAVLSTCLPTKSCFSTWIQQSKTV